MDERARLQLAVLVHLCTVDCIWICIARVDPQCRSVDLPNDTIQSHAQQRLYYHRPFASQPSYTEETLTLDSAAAEGCVSG